MTEEQGSSHDGGATREQEALWTRLFADWLEEQAELVIRELEGERRDGDGAVASDRPGRGAGSAARGR